MTEFDLAWIRRRTQALIAEDLVPAAARMIAIQEAAKRRECQRRATHRDSTRAAPIRPSSDS